MSHSEHKSAEVTHICFLPGAWKAAVELAGGHGHWEVGRRGQRSLALLKPWLETGGSQCALTGEVSSSPRRRRFICFHFV